MSEEGLEVPHQSHGGSGPLGQWVAIFTAILAALGAAVSYQGSHLMNQVLLKKNEAVLHKAAATNEWNHYQATSTKTHVVEMAQLLLPAERSRELDEKLKKYNAQKDELTAKAEALDAASRQAWREAEELDRPHARFAQAMIFLQIAISLASITALTQRRWLFVVAYVAAAIGMGLCATAMLLGG
jgi:hypothetical protein